MNMMIVHRRFDNLLMEASMNPSNAVEEDSQTSLMILTAWKPNLR